jgi:hypothetical protein
MLVVVSSQPLAYLLTWPTYGSRLHGDERWSVDRKHNQPNTPMLDHNPKRLRWEREQMSLAPVVLSDEDRRIVAQTIQDYCGKREWELYAIAVQTNHVHLVVRASAHKWARWADWRDVFQSTIPSADLPHGAAREFCGRSLSMARRRLHIANAARFFGLAEKTAEKWYYEYVERNQKSLSDLRPIRSLGIDELSLKKSTGSSPA